MIDTGAAASTGPIIAPGPAISSEADAPTSQLSEATQNLVITSSTNSLNQSDSPVITDPLMNLSQDMASLASAALNNSVPNPDTLIGDKRPTVLSHLEPAIATTASEMALLSLEDPQQQVQPSISNLVIITRLKCSNLSSALHACVNPYSNEICTCCVYINIAREGGSLGLYVRH